MNLAYQFGSGVLILAGAAAANFGLVARYTQASLAWPALVAGLLLLSAGFFLACTGRGTSSRASVAFITHVTTSIMTAVTFHQYRTTPGLSALLATTLACQVVVGLILLPCVIEAKRRVGPIFLILLLAYVAMLGGSIYVAVKVF